MLFETFWFTIFFFFLSRTSYRGARTPKNYQVHKGSLIFAIKNILKSRIVNTNSFLVLIYGTTNPFFFAGFPLDLFSFKGTDLAEYGISRCLNLIARPTLCLQKYFLKPDSLDWVLSLTLKLVHTTTTTCPL